MAETEKRVRESHGERHEVLMPFYPDFALREAMTAFAYLIVLLVVASLTRPTLEATADPNATSFIPRPEWYFLWLFEMLKYFKGELEWVGAVAVPGLGVAALIALPFIDRRAAKPRPLIPGTRPIRMWPRITGALLLIFIGWMTWNGTRTRTPVATKGPELTAAQAAGKATFEKMGCMTCHVVGTQGGKRGPDLTHFGADPNARDKVLLHFAGFGSASGSIMPGYQLSPEEMRFLSEYLLSQK